MIRPECQHCDCNGPDECLFGAPEVERPSLAIVWIVGAVVVLAVVVAILALI